MDSGITDFEACIRAPSPAPNFPAIPPFGGTQYIRFHPPTSSIIESGESSGSFYSRPYTSMESTGSRTSWSSANMDWAKRDVAIKESHRALQRENLELSKQVSVWQAKFETLQSAYNLLIDRVPAPPEAERPKLNPNDFKHIDYWYKHQWMASSGDRVTDITGKVENEDEDVEDFGEDFQSISPTPAAQRGQGRSRAGINVSLRYIQNQDGQVIDGHRAREMCIHARALFVGFAMQGKRFVSWGDADAESRKYFYNEMVNRFEELQYCDLDWKTEQIATDTFPGWKVTWLKKQKKRSSEHQSGAKRAHQPSAAREEPDSKRSKAGENTSTLSAPPPEAFTSQLTVPMVNIIPSTPVRQAPPAAPSFNIQGPSESWDFSCLRPDMTPNNFSINNPLACSINAFSLAVAPPAEQLTPAVPATNTITSQSQQAINANSTQPILGNNAAALFAVPNPPQALPPPVKRSRTGATKMRPSKTSTTPRNLCALEWAVSNPKGTSDQFSTYYDGLPAEEKEKWEKLSVEAKESAKTAS